MADADKSLTMLAMARTPAHGLVMLVSVYRTPLDPNEILSSVDRLELYDDRLAGAALLQEENDFLAMDALPDSTILLGTSGGELIRFTDPTVTRRSPGFRRGIEWIHCAADGAAFVVGSAGERLVIAPDGTELYDAGEDVWLRSVHALSSQLAMAVGADGTILRFESGVWTSMDSGTNVTLLDVEMRARDDAWACGPDGVLLHWDGRVWAPVSVPVHDFTAVQTYRGELHVAAGNDGIFVLRNGTLEDAFGSARKSGVADLAAFGDLLYAFGGDILREWNGTRWRGWRMTP